METIPQIVLDYAHNEGFNTVEFVCDDYKEYTVYSVSIIDKNGMSVPIGPPMFLLLQGNIVRYSSVEEGLEICRRL